MIKQLNTGLFKDFSKLLSGKVFAQIIAIIFYPILTRIYLPDEFGVFGIFQSTITIATVIAAGQLHSLLPNARDEKTFNAKLWTSLLYIVFWSLIATVLVLALSSKLDEFYSGFHYFLPFGIFVFALNEVIKIWYISKKKYGGNSVIVNINRLSSNLLKTFFKKLGLIFSELVANTFCVFYFFFQNFKELKATKFNPSAIKQNFLTHLSYPTLFTLGTLAVIGTYELPVFFLKSKFATEIVGLYVVANKFCIQPFIMISSSLSSVLHNKFVDDHIHNNYNPRFFNKLLFGLLLISAAATVVLYFFGSDLLTLILGNKWSNIGPIITVLAPLIATKLMFGPTVSFFLAIKKIKLISIIKFIECTTLIVLSQTQEFPNAIEFLKTFVITDLSFDVIIILIALYSSNQLKNKSL